MIINENIFTVLATLSSDKLHELRTNIQDNLAVSSEDKQYVLNRIDGILGDKLLNDFEEMVES